LPWKFLCKGWNYIFQLEIWWNVLPREIFLKKIIGTSFGPDHKLKRLEAILCSFGITKEKGVWRGNVHVCHFVSFGRKRAKNLLNLEMTFVFEMGLTLQFEYDHALKPSQKMAPPLIRLLVLIIAKKYSRQQGYVHGCCFVIYWAKAVIELRVIFVDRN